MLDPHEAVKETSQQAIAGENNNNDGANDNDMNCTDQQAAADAPQIDINQLNLNCSYDFRPTNFNFLMLSRFSFASKKRRIQKLIRKTQQAKKAQLKKSLARVEDLEGRGLESRQRTTMIENKTLETLYPKLYRDYIETRVKQDEQLRE